MRNALLIILVASAAGCESMGQTRVGFGQYYQFADEGFTNEKDGGKFPTEFFIEHDFNERWTGRCFHMSFINAGRPGNLEYDEDEINACGVRLFFTIDELLRFGGFER